jgi:hypothetical protein
MKARFPSLLFLTLVSGGLHAQMTVDSSVPPTQLVQNILLGQGVSASNVTFNGVLNAPADLQIGSFSAPGTNLGLDAGVVMASGNVMSDPLNFIVGANGPVTDFAANNMFTGVVDADLALLANQAIFDAAILEFDFIPTGDSLKFNYVFGSEEYPSFTCTIFNDVFGFFLSGPGINGPYSNNAINIALVPGTNVPVAINTVNSGTPSNGDPTLCAQADPNWQANSVYFVDNAGQSGVTVTYDGFTTVLQALALVECGLTYHIKLAIGDGSDGTLDSGVFLEAGSFTSSGQVIPTLVGAVNVVGDSLMYEGCGQVILNLERYGDSTNIDTVNIVIGGTATPGVDYSPALPSQLIYQVGDTLIQIPLDIPLDADGLETITMQITQNIVCSGQQVTNNYTFYIDTPPPLAVITNDVNGVCGQQYVLAPNISGGTGDWEILWNTGDTTPTITVSPAVTTVYSFTVSDTCSVVPWTDSITVTMPVYPPVTIGVSPDNDIACLGNEDISVTTISGGNGTYSFEWTLQGNVVGATQVINVPAQNPAVYYVVTVTDGCGLSDTDSILVSTTPLPEIVITAQSRTVICPGDTMTLTIDNVTGGNGVYTYAWTNAFNSILSIVDSLTVPVPEDAAYTITVEDQCGYVGDTTIYTLLPINDPFELHLNNDTVLCLGDSLRLWAHVTGGSGYYTIEWPDAIADTVWSDPYLWVKPEDTDTWTVNIFDRCGAVITDEVEVEVEKPEARIIATSRGLDDWTFEAATLPTFCRFYRWDLDDSTRSRERLWGHSFLDLEEHWVWLKVITFNGCRAEDSLLIYPPGQIYFPNAFTPDGDGLNETWGPA